MNKAMLCSFVPWVTRARKLLAVHLRFCIVGCCSHTHFSYVCHHWSPNPFAGCSDCRSKRPTTHQQRLWYQFGDLCRPYIITYYVPYHTCLSLQMPSTRSSRSSRAAAYLDPPVAATPRVVARAESQLHVRRRRRSNSWSGTKRVQSSSWNGSLDKLLGLRAQ